METIQFSKYHGANNDLIMINNTEGTFDKYRDNAEIISLICSRRTGVGSDGLVELLKHPDFVFEMVFYKASGERGRFGGNAARCAAAFAHTLGLTKSSKFLFSGSDGQHWADYDEAAGTVEIGMANILGVSVYNYNELFIDTGSPHHIVFLEPEALGSLDLIKRGRTISNNYQYNDIGGTNVNFVAPIGDTVLRIRTYERGVRGEIPACGTGSVACAIAHSVRQSQNKNNQTATPKSRPQEMETLVQCPAGDLVVKYRQEPGTNDFKNVTLRGPVVHVYSGTFQVPKEFLQ